MRASNKGYPPAPACLRERHTRGRPWITLRHTIYQAYPSLNHSRLSTEKWNNLPTRFREEPLIRRMLHAQDRRQRIGPRGLFTGGLLVAHKFWPGAEPSRRLRVCRRSSR